VIARRTALVTAISISHVLLLSSAPFAGKISLHYCPPFTLLTARSFIGALLLGVLVSLVPLRRSDGPRSWPRLVLFAVLQTLLPIVFNYLAVQRTSAGMVSIIAASNPLLVALLAPALLGDNLSARRLIGALLGFSGVVFVMAERLGAGGRVDTPLGMAFAVGIALSHVTSTILYKRIAPREHLLVAQAWQLLISGVILLPLALVLEDPWQVTVGLPLLGALGYIVVFLSIGSMLIWCWLLRVGEATATSSFLFLSPISGTALAAIFLGEHFTLRDSLGLLAIVIGIIAIRHRGAARSPAAHAVAAR
jgi:drug/metabolite transporter (DMT)-like permease